MQILQGHTYAIGLTARAAVGEVAANVAAQGWSLPPAHLAGALFYGGWAPVVYYAASSSPIAPPPDAAWLTTWVVIAYRAGATATVQGYAGEVSVLSPFGPDLSFVVDLNAPPSVARSLVADPAPSSPAWYAASSTAPAPAAAPAKPSAAWWLLALLFIPGPLTVAAVYAFTRRGRSGARRRAARAG